jgi:hypothetical protein
MKHVADMLGIATITLRMAIEDQKKRTKRHDRSAALLSRRKELKFQG